MSIRDSQGTNTDGSSSPGRENYNLPIDYGPSATYGTPVDPRGSQTQGLVMPEVHPSASRANGGVTLPASEPEKKLFGLKRKTFWILLIVTFIVAAVIAGGVGGGLASKKFGHTSAASNSGEPYLSFNSFAFFLNAWIIAVNTKPKSRGVSIDIHVLTRSI